MKKTKSWVVTDAKKMSLQEFDVPEVIADDELLLKVKCTCICGSDPHRYLNDDGKATNFYPLILGHEFAGVVEKIGPDAEKIYGVTVGDRVTVEPYIACGHCDYCREGSYQLCVEGQCYGWSIPATDGKHLNGAYGEYVVVRPNSRVFKLKDDVSFKAGALSSVIGNGYHLVMDKAQMKPNEAALILGPGALGLCTVVAAKEAGANPIIIAGVGDNDEKRLALGKELGADYTIRLDKEDIVKRVSAITEGKMADVVFECSGAAPAYKTAFSCIKKLGTIVLLGMTGGKEIPLSIDQIVTQELQIKGSIGQPDDVSYAVKTINKQIYPLEKMITNEFPMSKADKAIEFFISRTDPSCIRVALIND
ncbi:zinc-dependent alcohol dehydrogenase [Eubacterium barkeri]|uniref:L-iditol 2-dehydrogenase n=1 Tax=Eubacterium barkeri TaxID=1528 RepID=A0A1H3I7A8_EUBBA|nr:alcohol dehydrogenase catalytic domain-containing protein [Eubacterium barkeri]SDY22814.1 L-iditol 2-dehydrogenase [Eubacterium barkeri]